MIVGENRSGKSNFLDALRLVLDPALPDSQRTLRGEDFWDGLEKPFAGNIIEIKVYIRGFDDNKSAQSVLVDSIIKDEPLTALLTYQFRPHASIEENKDPKEADYEFVVFGGADEKNRVATEVRKWLAMVVLPALRDAETDMQSWKRSPLRPLLDRAKKLVEAGKLEEVRDILDDATKKLIQESSIKDLSQGINTRLGAMIGPVHSVETRFDFASNEPEQLLRSLRLFLKEKVSRPLSDASLGTANILFLSLLLQDLDAKIEAKELASTILAIEEPEAHLHPHLQRLLFRHFLRRDHSIIVTTHSPHLASVAPLRSLVLLRTASGETTGFTARKLGLSTEEVDDLQRYLDATRAELLFAKGVVLVEGPAEQFILPAFAAARLKKKKVATSLDEMGISVCSVHGTDFLPYAKFLSNSGMAIPHVVITDGDESNSHEVEKASAGLLRGVKLVANKDTRDKVQMLIHEAKYVNAKKALRSAGIFIGEATLELDLLPILASEFKDTYEELKGVGSASERFSESVDKTYEGDEDSGINVLTRIERIGKGRFAQRLASKIDGQEPPPYICEAIDSIIRTVREGLA